MATNGKNFKLFIGDEEVTDGVITDCNLDLLNNTKEMPELKTSRSWSASCTLDVNPDYIDDFYRAMMLEEIKELTDNYNRLMRIKNKNHE